MLLEARGHSIQAEHVGPFRSQSPDARYSLTARSQADQSIRVGGRVSLLTTFDEEARVSPRQQIGDARQ